MNNKGNSSILVIILVLVLGILLASAGSYYYLKSNYKAPIVQQNEPVEVDNSQSLGSLETDIENISLDEIEMDVSELDNIAESL